VRDAAAALGLFCAGAWSLSARAEQPPAAPALARAQSLSIEVADVGAAATRVTELAREHGGELRRREDRRLTLRVAPERFDALLEELSALGHIAARSASTRDLTTERADAEAAVAGAERARERLAQMKSGDVQSGLLVEQRIAEVEAQIRQHRAALTRLEQDARWVAVDVTLVGLGRVEPVPEHRLPIPWLQTLSPNRLQSSPPPEEPAPPIRANLDLSINLELRWLVERPESEAASAAAVAGFRTRGALTDPVGFAYGTDFYIGGWHGFVFGVGLGAGLGTSIGSVLTLGLIGGLRYDVWTGDRLPAALMAPAELFATVELDDAARLLFFTELAWSLTSTDRDDGAKLLEISDELSLGGAVLLPAGLGQNEIQDGGLRLGFVYGELLGTHMYTVTVGVGAGLVQH
jgi:hypothetical protein